MDEIVLEVGPIYTTINYPDSFPKFYQKQLNALLGNVMKARPEGYAFSPKFRNHMWDGYIKLFKNNTFPTGLLNKATTLLDKYTKEYEYDISIVRKDETTMDSKWDDVFNVVSSNAITHSDKQLRDYQIKAVKELLSNKRGIAWMSTNSGKTMVFGAIANILRFPTLVLTTKKELLYQTAGVMEECIGSHVGLVGDGHKDLGEMYVVGMIQTLHTLLGSPEFKEFADNRKLLVIDEAHHTSSRTMMDIVMAINAPYRFGFSGTPLKNDILSDLQLMAATGDVLFRVTNDQLIKEGYSTEPEIRIYKIDNLKLDLSYSEAYSQFIVNNLKRNQKIIEVATKAIQSNKTILILVEHIEHQNIIYTKYVKDHNIDTITCMNGKQDIEYRKEQLLRMKSNIPHIYIATTALLGEGIDIPAIDVVIIAGGGKSHIKLLQQVGRGMRKKEGKEKIYIIDFKDTGNKYLEKHSKGRNDIYKEEGFEIKEYE